MKSPKIWDIGFFLRAPYGYEKYQNSRKFHKVESKWERPKVRSSLQLTSPITFIEVNDIK